MKPVSTALILFLLAALASCGKDNKSGKNNNYGLYSNGYEAGFHGTGIGYNGYSLAQVVNENPCVNGAPPQARHRTTSPAQVNSVIPNGDTYVGVTSFGDVAVMIGTPQGPVFEAYICPRSMMAAQQSIPQGITLLPYTGCGFKQMNAKLPLSDGTLANFRAMDFGTSTGNRFSYCR